MKTIVNVQVVRANIDRKTESHENLLCSNFVLKSNKFRATLRLSSSNTNTNQVSNISRTKLCLYVKLIVKNCLYTFAI